MHRPIMNEESRDVVRFRIEVSVPNDDDGQDGTWGGRRVFYVGGYDDGLTALNTAAHIARDDPDSQYRVRDTKTGVLRVFAADGTYTTVELDEPDDMADATPADRRAAREAAAEEAAECREEMANDVQE